MIPDALRSKAPSVASAVTSSASNAKSTATDAASQAKSAVTAAATSAAASVGAVAKNAATVSTDKFKGSASASNSSAPPQPVTGQFSSPLRGADQIRQSGVLEQMERLQGVKVPASELNRTVEHDAILVQQDLSRMTPEQIGKMKEAAYNHPECKADLDAAIKMGHYGSAKHREYGALLEKLTGGVISAEEAMAMNPTGGIPGPNAKKIPLFADFGPVARHAMRHDATGFLKTRLNAGPGYGSKTTIFGRKSNDPLAGQILGVAREIFHSSKLPASDHVAKPGRFA